MQRKQEMENIGEEAQAHSHMCVTVLYPRNTKKSGRRKAGRTVSLTHSHTSSSSLSSSSSSSSSLTLLSPVIVQSHALSTAALWIRKWLYRLFAGLCNTYCAKREKEPDPWMNGWNEWMRFWKKRTSIHFLRAIVHFSRLLSFPLPHAYKYAHTRTRTHGVDLHRYRLTLQLWLVRLFASSICARSLKLFVKLASRKIK